MTYKINKKISFLMLTLQNNCLYNCIINNATNGNLCSLIEIIT